MTGIPSLVKRIVSPAQPGPLLPFLLTALAPMSRTKVKQWLTHGRIHVNGIATTRHDHPLKPGDRVTVGVMKEIRPTTLDVLFEDESLIAIDKPDGLLTVATETEKLDTAFVQLAQQLGTRPHVIHRLDRETSGVLLFAKSHVMKIAMQEKWDAVEKTYLAIVDGHPKSESGIVDNFLTEGTSLKVTASLSSKPYSKRAVSRYRVQKKTTTHSLVEVVIETGRKHQIRVHLAGLGCPVIGDDRYGSRSDPIKRLGLHAHRLVFPHPVTGSQVVVESPLPRQLARIV